MSDYNLLVSIIIPCYNPVYLHRALQSVCRQNYPWWEVLCVDDGSEMEFSSIIETINDPRIFYYCLNKHTNANVARNYGIEQSRGKYIAMLDSDDEWLETHLENSICILKERKVDGIYGSLILRSDRHDSVFVTRKVNDNETTADFLLSTGYGAQTSTLVMTALSAKDIRWDEKLKRHQDYDFVIRYSRKYNLLPQIKPTVIFYLSNAPKFIDFDSCIVFIESIKDEITDRIYMNYHKNMLLLAIKYQAREDIISYYCRAVTRYEYLLSFYDYLIVLQPRNKFKGYLLKLKYIWRLFLFAPSRLDFRKP